MTPTSEMRAAAERAQALASAYPEDVFLPVSKEDRDWLRVERPGLQDAIAGDMGRHLSQFFAENAKMLHTAADEVEALRARVEELERGETRFVRCGPDLTINAASVASIAWERRHYVNGPGDAVLVVTMADGATHRLKHSPSQYGGIDCYEIERSIENA